MALNIFSLNVRGLRDFEKRKDIFLKLKDLNADIILIQESHSSPEDEIMWQQQWGGTIFYSHGTRSSRGVMTLFRRNIIDLEPELAFDDNGVGRMIALNIKTIDGADCLLVNIYGPNEDEPRFFKNLFTSLRSTNSTSYIIGGDFNVPLVMGVDTTAKVDSHHLSRNIIEEIMDDLHLWDIWRAKNESVLKFTWFRLSGKSPVKSRLDYFLISHDLVSEINSCDIRIRHRTDHCAVQLVWTSESNARGPGLWKHNNRLLEDIKYLSEINDTIDKTLDTFQRSGPVIQWEMLKQKCIEASQKFAKNKASEGKKLVTSLEQKQSYLLAELNQNYDKTLVERLTECQNELQNITQNRVQSAIFRSKCTWYTAGEKNSKYFFNLERSRFKAKNITKLYSASGVTTEGPEILEIIKNFYTDLYQSKSSEPFTLENSFAKEVRPADNLAYFKDPTIQLPDVGDALAAFPANKTPGCDRLTAEFYKIFWNKLKLPLLSYYNECFKENCLGWTARRGVLSLLAKKHRDTLHIKNWRPITLLNMDYKILSKVLARKLQKVLPYIISDHQTGFMKGRNIKENARKAIEIAVKARRENIKAIIFSLDFQKCFDLCRHEALTGALKFFKFHENYMKWVTLLFKEFKLCAQNNGYCSPWWPQTRGLHQGCCWSPLGYLLCGEIFSLIISKIDNLDAFTYNQIKTLLSQFADDTDFFLRFKKGNIDRITSALDMVERTIGLQINYEKSTIYRIGSLKYTDAKLITQRTLAWSNEPLCVLGIYVHEDINERIKLNFGDLYIKVDSVLKLWSSRNLTLMGRILVVNTLVESLFVHRMQCVEAMPHHMYKKYHELILKFVWKGKRPKIAFSTLNASKKQGGLRLVNLEFKHRALLLNWIKTYQQSQFFTECVKDHLISLPGDYIWQLNLHKKDASKLCVNSTERSMWSDILYYWCHINFIDETSVNGENVLGLSIHYNSLLKYNRQIMVNEKLIKANILFVRDITDQGKILNYVEFTAKYGQLVNWLEYHNLYYTVKRKWGTMIECNLKQTVTTYTAFMSNSTPCKFLYNKFINAPRNVQSRLQQWVKYFPDLTYENFIAEFSLLYQCAYDTKLRDFQYRLLMRIIVTNKDLCQWRVITYNKCTRMLGVTEDLYHLFFDCPVTQKLWKWFSSFILDKYSSSISVNFENIIFNRVIAKPNHVFNLMTLQIKQLIYSFRCLDKLLTTDVVCKKFAELESIERCIALKNNKISSHISKWSEMIPVNCVYSDSHLSSINAYINNVFA